jgi:hypothetical protein
MQLPLRRMARHRRRRRPLRFRRRLTVQRRFQWPAVRRSRRRIRPSRSMRSAARSALFHERFIGSGRLRARGISQTDTSRRLESFSSRDRRSSARRFGAATSYRVRDLSFLALAIEASGARRRERAIVPLREDLFFVGALPCASSSRPTPDTSFVRRSSAANKRHSKKMNSQVIGRETRRSFSFDACVSATDLGGQFVELRGSWISQ